MLALLAFEVTVYRHQDFYRMRNNLTAPVTRTIFHNITRQYLDDGIINCAKYFINYFFYKFGLEVLHIICGINSYSHMEIFCITLCHMEKKLPVGFSQVFLLTVDILYSPVVETFYWRTFLCL